MNIVGISGLHNSVQFKRKELPHLSRRDYRIVQGFDSAAVLVTSSGIKAAAAEERFSKEKATGAFPINAIQYCLQAGNITPDAIDYVAHGFSYEPFRKFYDGDEFVEKQFRDVYSHEVQMRCLHAHFSNHDLSRKLIPVAHHLAHAASAFYLSGFEESLILIVDGMGEIHSTTIALGRHNNIRIIKQVRAPHSLGILYGVMTLYLGFELGMDEYKVMGLAPYGNPRRYFDKLMEFIQLHNDGTYAIPLLCQNYNLEEKETYRGTLQILANTFGPPREPGAEITQDHKDIAAALQAALQASLIHILRFFKRETSQMNLCLAGGVALNCTANAVIKRSRMFKGLFVQPAAADDGSALGAALFVQRLHDPEASRQKMPLPFWGPHFETEAIQEAIARHPECESTHYDSFDNLLDSLIPHIAAGRVVAWFQGRMEFGPRALGNRSILADPRNPEMRNHINRLVKKREAFRPFAPAVTREAAIRFFDIDQGDESQYSYMLLTASVRPTYREQLPAVTHVDGSARLQIVSNEDHPRFWTLLNKFGAVSGIPVLLNTSFNLRGQPIVCTPDDALDAFLISEIDILVIENYLITHRDRQSAG
ncbi:MAG TPA: carbamoyltransferase C-terminal domain-containing protein [Pyrinomonadaceae bacterium]